MAHLRKSKHSFLLLEVLIAFALVTLCAIPLIYPHTAIYRAQREFVSKIELDHEVNLIYVDLLQKLHRNEIPLADIRNETLFTLPQTINGYTGTYQFKTIREKSSLERDGPAAMLAGLDIQFKNSLTQKTYLFAYKVFLGFKSDGAHLLLEEIEEDSQ